MKAAIEPLLHPVAITDLRPTQMTLGYREVERKRAEWRARAPRDGGEYLGRHMVPAVLGPRDRPYLVDHHHLVRALQEEKVERVLVTLLADLSKLDKRAFWTFMDNRNWLHPFDREGKRRPHGHIPKSIADLEDDPYRSLAGELRRSGGYAKDATPYSEFLCADFLRRHIDRDKVEAHFQKALIDALDLAHSRHADYLPGWCGPSDPAE